MKATTAIGIVIAFVGLALGATMEGSQIPAFFNVPALVIIMSGHGTVETAVKATKLGAYDFIEKPLSLEKLLVTLRNAFQMQELKGENKALRSEVFKEVRMIGSSEKVMLLKDTIATVAPCGPSTQNAGASTAERPMPCIEYQCALAGVKMLVLTCGSRWPA